MGKSSRREFLEKVAAGSAGACVLNSCAEAVQAGPLGLPIGSQIYHLRPIKDFPAFVKMVAGIGVRRLELCSPIGYGADFAMLTNGKEVKKIMADQGIKAESCHFSLAELRKNQEKSIAWAKEVGIRHMITSSLGDGNGGSNPTLDQVKKAADEYNRIAAAAARAGMQQGLHNEGFELSMIDGRRTYDRLFELLDPKLVKFQFQMSTISAGLVAADYFVRYPGRFVSIHVQDLDMKSQNTPAQPATSPVRHSQVPVGKGSIDWVRTFQAARKAGIKSYFVEQNWELTQQSVAYLKTLKV